MDQPSTRLTYWDTESGQQFVTQGADKDPIFTVRSPDAKQRDAELRAIAASERERLDYESSTPGPSSRASTPVLPTMVSTAPLDTAAKKRSSPFAPTAFFDLASSASKDAPV